jgi:hypothetical protein
MKEDNTVILEDDEGEFGVSTTEGCKPQVTTTLWDVFAAFSGSSYMSSIDFFKFCKQFRIYPVSISGQANLS